MKYLKVPRELGEKIRRELINKKLFANGYPILQEEEFVLFPVMENVDKERKEWKKFEIVEREAKSKEKHPGSLKEALFGTLNESEFEELTTSFDIIGDIVIIEIPDELLAKEKSIGQAVLKTNRTIKTVLKKLGPMEGEYRVRRMKVIAGENRTETVYRENGVPMKLDVTKVYFSVRLSHERKRISELVEPNENVLVLFAGIGPFALVIAKQHPDANIVAVELNPEAVRYMRENVKMNKFGNIIVEEGDARKVILEKYQNFANRIVMPLPKDAHEFLDVAFAGAKNGGIIHFYSFVEIEDAFEKARKIVEREAEKSGVRFRLIGKRIVRPYSPTHVQVVLDLKIVAKNNHM